MLLCKLVDNIHENQLYKPEVLLQHMCGYVHICMHPILHNVSLGE